MKKLDHITWCLFFFPVQLKRKKIHFTCAYIPCVRGHVHVHVCFDIVYRGNIVYYEGSKYHDKSSS